MPALAFLKPLLSVIMRGAMFVVPFLMSGAKGAGGKLKKLKPKQIAIGVGVLIGGYWAYKQYKKMNLERLPSGMSKDDKTAYSVASQIAAYMGTDNKRWYSFLDPSTWYEKEEKVIKIMQEHSHLQSLIEDHYIELTGSSIAADVNKYFNADQKEKFYESI